MSAQRRPRHSLAGVRAEIDRTLAALDGIGSFMPQAIVVQVSKALNGRYDPYDHSTEGQVRRDLEARAQAGQLVKVGRGAPGPGGERNAGRYPVFYLPEAYREAEKQAADRRRREADIAARWGRIYDDLLALDIYPLGKRGEEPRISPASWDKLTGEASGGE